MRKMSSFRLYAPPCCCWASSSSLASRCAIERSRRLRAKPTSQRTASVRARRGGGPPGARGGGPPPPPGGPLDGHLVGRAADPAGADLEHGRERLDGRLEGLDRVLARALGEDRQRVIDDALGRRLLAVQHHLVDDLLDELGAVDGIGVDRPLGCGGAAWHYFALTPYCERAFLRSETPAASR